MSAENEVSILRRLAIFQLLTSEQLRLLVFGADKIVLARGQQLFFQNDIAHSAFIILSGRIDLKRTSSSGAVTIESVERGSLIGELALISETTRSVSAVAANSSLLLQIKREKFQRLLVEYPELAYAIHAYVRNNMHDFFNQINSRFRQNDVD